MTAPGPHPSGPHTAAQNQVSNRASSRAPARNTPVLEARARDTAVRGLASPGLLGPLPAARRTAPDAAGLLPRGSGRPLPEATRRRAEARLGLDLAGVRLHTGAQAAARAEALGANAFALGDDVVMGDGRFAPETREGEALLMHELSHVAQARTGAATGAEPLHDDPPRPRGIGAAPPREAFDVGEGVMPETNHVLFERDSADLDPGDLATIEALFRDRTRRLWIDVYGYASMEGDAAYNANLSAHRGVAVRHAIEPLMPPGSLLDVHAQGETGDFGSIEENRRAGIRVREAPDLLSLPPLGPGLLGDWRFRLDPGLLTPPSLDPAAPRDGDVTAEPAAPVTAPQFNPFVIPPLFPGPFLTRPDPLAAPPPIFTGEGVDWTALARSATLRGGSVDPRDAEAADRLYLGLFPFWSWLLGPDLGDTLSRGSVSRAYESYQYRQNPTQWDRWMQEDEARGTSVRGLSIDLLDPPWARKKKKP
ncbi:protein of unknown function [Novosphingobium sp. CF614]|uniref:eCIS core domain-containing protein n=1 Tax=Novosphingobium sp. CF614 TaxID=1884364 RepID=UPI0008E3686E|nr:DUF4157 domain-containing protein [Novosphingobium sp. CF614]SFF76418.1 protein of unknown function [Novosphingobium sp. CF614]